MFTPNVTFSLADFTDEISGAGHQIKLSPSYSGTTDSSGDVTFSAVTPGIYTINAAGIGSLRITVPNAEGPFDASDLVNVGQGYAAPGSTVAGVLLPNGKTLKVGDNMMLTDSGDQIELSSTGGTPGIIPSDVIGYFSFGDLPGVTSLTFNMAVSIAGFDIESVSSLASVEFPNLTAVDPDGIQGGYFNLIDLAALETFSAPLLEYVSASLSIDPGLLTEISLPSLVHAESIDFGHGTLLETISLPLLSEVVSVVFNTLPALTSVSIPSLTTCDGLNIKNNLIIETLDLSSLLSTTSGLIIQNNAALVSLNLSAYVPPLGVHQLNGNALNVATVNAFLAACVANAAFTGGGTIDLSGGTNAAPTGQGLTDKTTLEGRGVTVTVRS